MAARPAGLCSVTFRDRSVEQVAALAADAGLAVVEWGGDTHVPPGDDRAAVAASRASAEAGLGVVSYGSYLVCDDGAASRLGAVLDTTEALGAPAVRVWCPFGATDRREVVDAAAEIAAAADRRGLVVYLEFHGGTLTDSAASAAAVLDDVGATNLFVAWQPPYWAEPSTVDDRADLRALGPRLAHLHVYEWDRDLSRHPLARGAAAWPARLTVAAAATSAFPGAAALLEFVADDDPANLVADAAVLLGWLAEVDGGGRHG